MTKSVREIIQRIIQLREKESRQLTLLAVCPNSEAVLEAAILSAEKHQTPMLLAATLNQVDRDGGYTRWTPDQFVRKTNELSSHYQAKVPIFPCLDHGGLWLKDIHSAKNLSLQEIMNELKLSLTAFLQAGYQLMHIDPTVDRSLPKGSVPSVELIVSRTIELIQHTEAERKRMDLPPISYEVGSEEVHGGMADLERFRFFLEHLRSKMNDQGLIEQWPCFIVAQVGTNLHTTRFDAEIASKLTSIVAPHGSLIKGHYSDWVENPQDYPLSGMGGANVGPEFTAVELQALTDLEKEEIVLNAGKKINRLSQFAETIQQAVINSERWKKWLLPGEEKLSFSELSPERKQWLVETGARYVWTEPSVIESRHRLYENVSQKIKDPNQWVVAKIADRIEHYISAFNLENSWKSLKG
jgi:tagatose-1,6-bisphosphate aldolase non-catalytic subunit AgaZ/GatZ